MSARTAIIEVDAQTASLLRQRAEELGQSLPEFLREVAKGDAKQPTIPPDQWSARFLAWVSAQASRNALMDDARASIYEGRGE